MRNAMFLTSFVYMLGCGEGGNDTPPEPKSGARESCAKTADCEEGMKCIDQVCHDQCMLSDDCKAHGKCLLMDGVCTVTAEDCKRSSGCKQTGACSVYTVSTGMCYPLTDADCQQSEACANNNKCCVNGNLGCSDVCYVDPPGGKCSPKCSPTP